MSILIGTNSSNTLTGTSSSDIIIAGGGNDVINGGGGSDLILAGAGDDIIDGGAGDDFINGGTGNDTFIHNVTMNIDGNKCLSDFYDGNKGVDTLKFVVTSAQAADLQAALIAFNASNKSHVFDFHQYVPYIDLKVVNIEKVVVEILNPPPANGPPTDIALTNTSVDENLATGTTVGTLSATDPNPGDTLTFSLVAGYGDNSLFSIAGNTLKTAASFNYEADHSYDIKVMVDDGHGGTFPKTFTVTVNDVNDAPIANGATATGTEDSLPSINVLNESGLTPPAFDPDAGHTLSFGSIAGVTLNDVPVVAATYITESGGVLSVNDVFQGLAAGESAELKVSYTIVDEHGASSNAATDTFTITGINDAPIATDAPATGTENSLPSINVLNEVSAPGVPVTASDPDAGHTLSFGAISAMTLNNATIASTDFGTYITQSGGVLSVNDVFQGLAAGESAVLKVGYTIVDEHGASSNTATDTFTITGVNDAPIANDAAATGTEDNLPSSINVLNEGTNPTAFDPDAGHTLSFGAISAMTLNGVDVASSDFGTYITQSGGVLGVNDVFQGLAAGQSAELKVDYTILDEHGASSNTATDTFTITGVNDAPDAIGTVANKVAMEGDPFNLNLTLGSLFTDVDGDLLTVSTTGLPSWLSFNQQAGSDLTLGTGDDVLHFGGTPPTGAGGGTISLIANDGTANSAAIDFSLTVHTGPVTTPSDPPPPPFVPPDVSVGPHDPPPTTTIGYP